MRKSDFLADVRHEIDMLKKHATKEELSNLNFDAFDPESPAQCIYGQATGSCESPRAKELMDKACIRVMDFKSHRGANAVIRKSTFKYLKDFINGSNKGQGWTETGSRNYTHLSALEAYICLKDANNKGIIKYLRGEAKTLRL